MLFGDLVQISEAVAGTTSRLQKIQLLRDCLRCAHDGEIALVVAYLSGVIPQGRIGVGPAAVRACRDIRAVTTASLHLQEVDARLTTIAETHGVGSTARRRKLLAELIRELTAEEGRFLRRLLLGELRQGALEGVMLEAVAAAAGLPLPAVRRAYLLANSLPKVANTALREGMTGLAGFRLQVLRPVRPMLAQPADDLDTVMREVGVAALEYKLDGVRIQVHKHRDRVVVYSRSLNDLTRQVPEVVALVQRLPARSLVLDGEVLALDPDGTPRPFQVTMQRLGRKADGGSTVDVPLTPFFFDCLHVDGKELLDRPWSERDRVLDEVVDPAQRIPSRITGDPEVASEFLKSALGAGHEGVMVKAIDSTYEAGARRGHWRKIKPSTTMDLIVLAAEWGSGRRRGWLSNLHLGALDPGSGSYVMLGKTFKGLTDEMMAWQTRALLEREVGRDGPIVHVRPELVVEVAFNDVQRSRRYPGGVALRFARVKRYRRDKAPTEVEHIAAVQALVSSPKPPSSAARLRAAGDGRESAA